MAGPGNGSSRGSLSGNERGSLFAENFVRVSRISSGVRGGWSRSGDAGALAALRKQIEAVELPHFAAFMQRWQHLDDRDRLDGVAGTTAVMRQLYGIARPPVAWDRDYLRARIKAYDPASLSAFTATGEPVWAGEGNYDPESGAMPLARVRFFERGTGAVWLGR